MLIASASAIARVFIPRPTSSKTSISRSLRLPRFDDGRGEPCSEARSIVMASFSLTARSPRSAFRIAPIRMAGSTSLVM